MFDSPETFFFLDPPYENDKENDYEHYISPEIVYESIKNIKGKFLLTYNNSPNILKLFKKYRIIKNNVLYEHTQYTDKRNVVELIIMNY